MVKIINCRLPLLLLTLAGLFAPSLGINCYRDLIGEPEACPTSGGVINTVQSGLGSFWKTIKDGVQDISGKDWIDDFGETIKTQTGIDITSHEKNKEWVQSTLKKIGADFDVSGNCYITYDKSSGETLERGCGAVGKAGTFAAEAVKWMQGKSFNFWANSVCFSKPGAEDKEVCMCSKGDCNKDKATARKACGINNPNAKAAICNGEECPLADLSKIDAKYDFNSACYTGGEDSIVKCFTSDILTVPEAAALTRNRRSTDDGYTLINIDGEDNGKSGQDQSSHGMLAVILALVTALILQQQ
jgi:hypothetical protein